MRAKIVKVISQNDRQGRPIWIICFKGEDGRSYKTWTGKMFGNYVRWFGAVNVFRTGDEIWLNNLVVKGKRLIDADSRFEVERIKKGELIRYEMV